MWGISFPSVSSVQFGEEARGWGVAEETDMRLSLEITIDRHDLCARVYVYMCVHVDIMHVSNFFCIYTHTLLHTQVQTHRHTCINVYISPVNLCMNVRIYVHMYVYTFVCFYVSTYLCMACVCVCVCVRARAQA